MLNMPANHHSNEPSGEPRVSTRRPPSPSSVRRSAGPRVLIIRPSALGDVSRTVPALVTLRHAMPDAQIDWLVHEAYADVIRHHPDLNGLVTFPRKRFGAIGYNPAAAAEALRWSRDLRSNHYDIVFDLQGLLRSGLFTRLTAAPRRVGFANAREFAWLGYNRRHTIDPKQHTVDRMLSLLEAEGIPPQHDTTLYLGHDDEQWLDGWLEQQGITGPYACLAPTARWRCKCWPIENYAAISQRLLDSNIAGNRLVVLAAPDEHQAVAPLLDQLGGDRRVVVPQTTVGQMMAILSRSRLLVCNDSAPLHIAVGFKCPIAAIFGPTDPALVGPYHCDDTVLRPTAASASNSGRMDYRRHRDDQSLIAQVSIDEVWEKVREQLDRAHDADTAT